MVSIGGTSSTVIEAIVSGSVGISSNATVSTIQAVPPNIPSTVPLLAVGQTLAPGPMPKCDLCLHLVLLWTITGISGAILTL